jgi:hypothetical protein
MGDSPATSETFLRQFYPEDESVEAHHKAITAQARQHERSIILSRETHGRVKRIDEGFTKLHGKVDEIQLALAVRAQEQATERASKTHRSAMLVAGIAAFATIIGAGAGVVSAYVMRPAPQVERPTITPEMLERIRLLEQRDGYRIGRQTPAESQK